MIKSVPIKEFKYGTISSIDEDTIPRGAAYNSLNWITQGNKIELRRGSVVMGTVQTGVGKITGLGVGRRPDGTDIIFRTRKRKVEYYDVVTSDWVEVGTNILPAEVIADDPLGEDVSLEAYVNQTGEQMWINSPNCGPVKIMTANPGSYTNMYTAGTNYKGRMRIKNGRTLLWNRNGSPTDTTSLYGSKLDVKGVSDYTQISAEAIAGTGFAFTGTLAFKGAGAKRICFQVTFERDTSAETFTDNGDGTLTSSAGGTGTINYTTGAYSITFIGSASAVTATYRWADDSSGGIADFNFSSTRVAGEGFILRQAGGGNFQNVASLNKNEYCLHENKTWVVSIGNDDLDISNLIYRSKVGIPNHRALVETGDGVYYIDDTDSNDPQIRLLRLAVNNTEVIPSPISKQFKLDEVRVGIDLSGYVFDQSSGIESGDFIIFGCRTSGSDTNNRTLIYNKVNKACDMLDYYANVFANYNGTLVAGDSVTDNVYVVFSGTDDLESQIGNYWESGLDNLGYAGMKRVVELTIDGAIGPEQSAMISMSVDRGQFVEVLSPSDLAAGVHAIEGNGDYVDTTQKVDVGSYTLGRGIVAGGGDGLTAYHYRRSFRIVLDKFEFVKFRVEALKLGYLSVSEFTFRDVRVKWNRIPNKYRLGR